jgi:hypothetical protein
MYERDVKMKINTHTQIHSSKLNIKGMFENKMDDQLIESQTHLTWCQFQILCL